MSSEKTAQVAAEEHAAQIWRMEPYGAESDSEKDFLTGVTWAKKHDPDVLKLVEAVQYFIDRSVPFTTHPDGWIRSKKTRQVMLDALESYRKATGVV